MGGHVSVVRGESAAIGDTTQNKVLSFLYEVRGRLGYYWEPGYLDITGRGIIQISTNELFVEYYYYYYYYCFFFVFLFFFLSSVSTGGKEFEAAHILQT